MKRYYLCLICLALLMGGARAFTQGRSVAMTEELNAKTPEWLSIGVPIRAVPATDADISQASFRSRSGGATNSRNRVQIPGRGIEIKLGYEVDWTGNNEIGTGVSLSPDGKKLLVNSGSVSHFYQFDKNGAFKKVEFRLPQVTYDVGLKGYLRGWSWADDQTLVARAEITDDSGHEIIENRIYVFHVKEGVLSRLDLTALNLPETTGIDVVEIGSDLTHLKLSIGSIVVMAKADLNSPPKRDKRGVNPPESNEVIQIVPPRRAEGS